MAKKKVIAIVGSLREKSYNKQLANVVKEMLGDKIDFEILNYQDVPFFNEDIEHPAPESVARVRKEIRGADALWIFTPEYNHSYSGVLKNLLDWLSRAVPGESSLLAGKPVALTGAALGITGSMIAQDQLVTLLSILNMKVMNAPRVTIPSVYTQADAEGNLALTTSKEFLEKQVEAFLAFIGA